MLFYYSKGELALTASLLTIIIFFFISAFACSLFCRIDKTVASKGGVNDGTRCYFDKKKLDVCIEGRCRVGDIIYTESKLNKLKIESRESTAEGRRLFLLLRIRSAHTRLVQERLTMTTMTTNSKVFLRGL